MARRGIPENDVAYLFQSRAACPLFQALFSEVPASRAAIRSADAPCSASDRRCKARRYSHPLLRASVLASTSRSRGVRMIARTPRGLAPAASGTAGASVLRASGAGTNPEFPFMLLENGTGGCRCLVHIQALK